MVSADGCNDHKHFRRHPPLVFGIFVLLKFLFKYKVDCTQFFHLDDDILKAGKCLQIKLKISDVASDPWREFFSARAIKHRQENAGFGYFARAPVARFAIASRLIGEGVAVVFAVGTVFVETRILSSCCEAAPGTWASLSRFVVIALYNWSFSGMRT